MKIHIGPGHNWKQVKGYEEWFCLDIDPSRATDKTGVIDFNKFKGLPFENDTCEAIYASHTFEHINPAKFSFVLRECFRVLNKVGCIRIVIPDPVKSIKEYLSGNYDFKLFKRRARKCIAKHGWKPTLFELMREDFISISGQPSLLRDFGLAHQNAWDQETMIQCLNRAGFEMKKIHSVNFKESKTNLFDFEETYKSEAQQHTRSQYFEAFK